MSLPKKRSKKISVDEVVYRYHWSWPLIDEPATVIIELAEDPESKLWASFDAQVILEHYASVGKRLSRSSDPIGGPPFVVRQTILLALAQGWRPDAQGSHCRIERAHEQIDFGLLRKPPTP